MHLNKILLSERLTDNIKRIIIKAPAVADKCLPGQFVIVRVDETGERIPLSITDYDRSAGTLTLVFREVGVTTKKLGLLEAGGRVLDLAGPLGRPSEIIKNGAVIAVGGGLGAAPLFPLVRAHKKSGNYVITVIGARNSRSLVYRDETGLFSDELYVVTDDGSEGDKGYVSGTLDRILKDPGRRIDRVICIGPMIMMKTCAGITRQYGVKTIVSLDTIMVDGTGMCGSCRVSIGDKVKFACVDGPDFDAEGINFDELIVRQQRYRDEEGMAGKIFTGLRNNNEKK